MHETSRVASSLIPLLDVGTLHYGDNLDVLRGFDKETVDLIYLDPPFNSDRAYNVFFRAKDGEDSGAQIQAFGDTWKWGTVAEDQYKELTEGGAPDRISEVMRLLRDVLQTSDLMAYLVMMTPRLVELYRVLKPTGSLYLHCDPTASHYLKVILDVLFGPLCFRNEIIWRRTGVHTAPHGYAAVHDTILFYTKNPTTFYFKAQRTPYMRGHVERRYTKDKHGYKFTSGGNVLTGPEVREGESGQPWKGFNPTAKRRHWAIPGFIRAQMGNKLDSLGVLKQLDAIYKAGLIEIVPGNAWPTPVRYLRKGDGNPLGDIWAAQPYTEKTVYGTDAVIDDDVQWLGPTDPERLDYPTQKPVGLLERIIRSSCPEGGVVLDPFCGCGTTVEAAERLKREWIGIDITYLAIDLIERRLRRVFGSNLRPLKIEGAVPRDIQGARKLFAKNKLDFERWAVSKVDGQPNKRQVGDKGTDGTIRFSWGFRKRGKITAEIGRAVVSVKGGAQLDPKVVRELAGVVDSQKAMLGVLVVMDKPTRGMVEAAADAGTVTDPLTGKSFPKVQIVTVKELFDKKRLDMPTPFAPYVKAKHKSMSQASLELPIGASISEERELEPIDEAELEGDLPEVEEMRADTDEEGSEDISSEDES